ncbi:hypothetical protein ACFQBQ_04395 [Granulicella cerasi]|uniref:DoxX family membrane protein n=1 Tax=Granulicella cerasi TaxID=741063 RepID=A0ABW1Z9I8_9BACT|nr:hypothetical protein [Granulicella cerasi]
MSRTTTAQDITRIAMGAALAGAGITHLTVAREEFKNQVPPWMPFDTDAVVLASGVGEIALGTALALAPEKLRPLAGCAAAGFFAAIFPGNLAQYTERRNAFGLDTDKKRFGRLFFQPVLIGLALWSAGTIAKKRKRLF